MIPIRQQRGATLFIALVFLMIMTMFAVSSINMSTTNLRIIGNMQAIKEMDASAQDAIEQRLSKSDNFGIGIAAASIATTVSGVNHNVAVSSPVCIDSRTATGYSAVVQNIIPEDNTWEVIASVTDSVTGATSTIHQGVEIRMLAGNCQ